MVSMPLNIGIGFLILGLSLPVFLRVLEGAFGGMAGQMQLSPEQQKRIDGARRQREEAMKKMTPEQRRQMEEMMKSGQGGAAPKGD